MFARLTANQRVWGAVGGIIVTGTIFKVGRRNNYKHFSWNFRKVEMVLDLLSFSFLPHRLPLVLFFLEQNIMIYTQIHTPARLPTLSFVAAP